MLESEIESHAREARDARAFIIACSARRAARNYSARGYGRESAPIPDTRGDDLNIPQRMTPRYFGGIASPRGEELDTRETSTSGKRLLYER